MNTLIKHNNRDLFRDLFSPFVINGFQNAMQDEEVQNNGFVPSSNVIETEKEFNITMALPGLKKEQIEVDVTEGLLTVKGSYAKEENEEGVTFHRKEISSGSFSRSFRLGTKINISKVDATFENGLLSISIPKKEDEKAKKIAIK